MRPMPAESLARTIFINRADQKLRSGWAIAVFFLAALGFGALLALLHDELHLPSIVALWLYFGVSLAATLVGVRVMRQPFGAAGFSDAQAGGRAAVGFGMGALLVAVVVGLPFLVHRLGLAGPSGPARQLAQAGAYQLALIAPPSAAEEVFMRGFFLRQLTRGINQIAAVLITGSLFGLLHMFNPNVVWLGIVNIVLVGIWLGLLVVRTGSLWLTMGLHVAWNWVEGWVFGQAVSGQALGTPLLRATWGDSLFWTGGRFGPEASGLCTIVLAAALAVTLAWPGWQREPRPEPVV